MSDTDHAHSAAAAQQHVTTAKRVVVTRGQEQADEFAVQLSAVGFTPVLFPVIQFVALPSPQLDKTLDSITEYDWLVFTSGNAVDFFWRRVDEGGLPLSLPSVAVVGSATLRKLAEHGIRADFVPAEFTGTQLALGLGDLTGKRVLLPRARIGRPEIVALLQQQGAVVDDVALYDTVTAVPTPQNLDHLAAGFDAITFTSPSSVRNFFKIIQPELDRFPRLVQSLQHAAIACIGPSTAAAAQSFDLCVDLIPDEYTIDGLILALVQHFGDAD